MKFIKKTKVLADCWVEDEVTGGKIPLEISLLSKLSHPNIVQVCSRCMQEKSRKTPVLCVKRGRKLKICEDGICLF